MTSSFPRSSHATSPWGLLLSVCFHGLAFLAIIVLSLSVSKVTKLKEDNFSRVTLVTSQTSQAVAPQIQAGPIEVPDMLPQIMTQTELPVKATENPRATLEARAVAPQSHDTIAIKKRKKPPRKVEVAKEPDKKKPQPETAKKKEDPQSFLEKRIAALRQEKESKKTDAASSKPVQGSGIQGVGRPDGKPGGPSLEEQRWFQDVKSKINSHWSIPAEDRQVERVTIVGVRIADDGRLMDASVDGSSGDQIIDRSALRAVVQAAPFPSIPPELKDKISKAGGLAFRFTPKGMQ